MKKSMSQRILGIDPGSRLAGFAIVECRSDGQIVHLAHGCLDVQKNAATFYERLVDLGQGFRDILERYQPQAVAIENIFLGKNADSAFKLGHARGVIAYEVAQKSLPVFEYATRSIKKTVTGTGSAEKSQVQDMLKFLLKIKDFNSFDASDALAVAYHHAVVDITQSRLSKLQPQRET